MIVRYNSYVNRIGTWSRGFSKAVHNAPLLQQFTGNIVTQLTHSERVEEIPVTLGAPVVAAIDVQES
jgi:hypothetical protein